MNPPASSRTVSIAIRRSPADVYAYARDIENFPQWSDFIRAVRRESDDWIFTTAQGDESRVHFSARNEWGILDHTVRPKEGAPVFVPLRVVANGAEHSEVLFTVFRGPTMSDADFEADIAMVVKDLAGLKRELEKTAD